MLCYADIRRRGEFLDNFAGRNSISTRRMLCFPRVRGHGGCVRSSNDLGVVPATGLEPVRCYSLEPESSASANSATRASGLRTGRYRSRMPLAGASSQFAESRLTIAWGSSYSFPLWRDDSVILPSSGRNVGGLVSPASQKARKKPENKLRQYEDETIGDDHGGRSSHRRPDRLYELRKA
jgi:hypothetical protein